MEISKKTKTIILASVIAIGYFVICFLFWLVGVGKENGPFVIGEMSTDFNVIYENDYEAGLYKEDSSKADDTLMLGVRTDTDNFIKFKYITFDKSLDISTFLYANMIDERSVIITFSNDIMHYNRLSKHIADQFVVIDEDSGTARVVYQSNKGELILYGNSEEILIFNSGECKYQWIDIGTSKVVSESEANVGTIGKSYIAKLGEDNQTIEIEHQPVWDDYEVVDVIDINQYSVADK